MKSSAVLPPIIDAGDPPFISADWLKENVDNICTYFAQADTNRFRIPPMGFIRCSHGGKTRALMEIALELKREIPEAAIIYVCFNGFSALEPWEQQDPAGALCRRIAFAARRNSYDNLPMKEAYAQHFAHAHVTTEHILDWLGEAPRILLMDEMDQLVLEALEPDTSINALFREFLKERFLIRKQNYFVFSSRAVATLHKLAGYMDYYGGRCMITSELPLIHNLSDTSRILNYPDLTARKAISYGLIPSLIYLGNKDPLPTTKTLSAIDECIRGGLVTDESVIRSLKSFITGDIFDVPEAL